MPTISIRLNETEEKCIKEIQDHMQKLIGKGIKITQSDVIRNIINEYYYQNITKWLIKIVYITILVIYYKGRGENFVLFAKHRLVKLNISSVIIWL